MGERDTFSGDSLILSFEAGLGLTLPTDPIPCKIAPVAPSPSPSCLVPFLARIRP